MMQISDNDKEEQKQRTQKKYSSSDDGNYKGKNEDDDEEDESEELNAAFEAKQKVGTYYDDGKIRTEIFSTKNPVTLYKALLDVYGNKKMNTIKEVKESKNKARVKITIKPSEEEDESKINVNVLKVA